MPFCGAEIAVSVGADKVRDLVRLRKTRACDAFRSGRIDDFVEWDE